MTGKPRFQFEVVSAGRGFKEETGGGKKNVLDQAKLDSGLRGLLSAKEKVEMGGLEDAKCC